MGTKIKLSCGACCVLLGPIVAYFGILGFYVPAYKMYLNQNVDWTNPKGWDPDAPWQFRQPREVHGVHSYDELIKYRKFDEVVIVRNFTDCAALFEEELLPRHINKEITYSTRELVEKEINGNAYTSGLGSNPQYGRGKKSLGDFMKAADPRHYTSFALDIFEGEVNDLLNVSDGRNLMDEAIFKETSFITHLDRPMVTTAVHCAVGNMNYGLQCKGTKNWLLWYYPTLVKHGIYATAAPSGILMSGTPESLMTVPGVQVTVNPGDLLMFAPLWFHAVHTEPGENVLITVREVHLPTQLRLLWESPRLMLLYWLRHISKLVSYSGGYWHGKNSTSLFEGLSETPDFWTTWINHRKSTIPKDWDKYDHSMGFTGGAKPE